MFKHFLAAITGNVISLIGTLLITISLLFLLALLIMQNMGFEGGAYLGIVTFVILPAMFAIVLGPTIPTISDFFSSLSAGLY